MNFRYTKLKTCGLYCITDYDRRTFNKYDYVYEYEKIFWNNYKVSSLEEKHCDRFNIWKLNEHIYFSFHPRKAVKELTICTWDEI